MVDSRHQVSHQSDRPLRDRRTARRHRADRAARSSWTPTAAWAGTAAARSRARIRRRWIARPATWRATSRRTSWRPAWPARCEVQLAYAIGVAEPVSVMVNTFGTGAVPEEKIVGADPRALPAHAAGHDRASEAAPADLSQDGGLRTLRPHRRYASPGKPPTRRTRCAKKPWRMPRSAKHRSQF